MKYLVLLFALSFSSELTFTSFQADLYSEFLSGFFSGLTNNNIVCDSSASKASETFQTLISDIQAYSTNYVPILADLTTLKQDLISMADSCNVAGLVSTIHNLLGPWGKATIMKNYVLHSRQISRDMAVINKCTENFHACGFSSGEIFRLVTGWNIKLALTETAPETQQKHMLQLLTQVVKTVEWFAPDYCSELPTRDILSTFIKLTKGEKVEESLQTLLNLWKDEPDLQDCAMHYGGMALYVLPSILTNPVTWNQAYAQEPNTILTAFNHLVSTCSKDYSNCGTQLGVLTNLLIQFTSEL